MKLAIIGAGLVGVATAYELTRAGHTVTVYERRSTAAEGASFACGGLIAPEWVAAEADGRWRAERAGGWLGWRRLLQAGAKHRHENPAAALLSLSRLGEEALRSIAAHHDFHLDGHHGLMALWRNEREAAGAADLRKQVMEMGGACAELSADDARALEAALNADTRLHKALSLPNAWTINARQFAILLRQAAQQMGCRFEFGVSIRQIEPGTGVRLIGDHSGSGDQRFDGVVLCSGSETSDLLRHMGLKPPLSQLSGHSVSAAIREPLDAPMASVYDVRQRVTIARLGQRVRISSASAPNKQGEKSLAEIKRLYAVLNDWFPGAMRLSGSGSAQEWHERVLTAPDGLPLIGGSGLPGVWLNVAHGLHGVATACSSARLVAHQLAGTAGDVNPAPFNPLRFNR